MRRCQKRDLVDPIKQAGGGRTVSCLHLQDLKQLLDHQTAEAMADQNDASILQSRFVDEVTKDVRGAIIKTHRGTLQARDGGFVFDRPDGMAVDVLGKPSRPQTALITRRLPRQAWMSAKTVEKNHV